MRRIYASNSEVTRIIYMGKPVLFLIWYRLFDACGMKWEVGRCLSNLFLTDDPGVYFGSIMPLIQEIVVLGIVPMIGERYRRI